MSKEHPAIKAARMNGADQNMGTVRIRESVTTFTINGRLEEPIVKYFITFTAHGRIQTLAKPYKTLKAAQGAAAKIGETFGAEVRA